MQLMRKLREAHESGADENTATAQAGQDNASGGTAELANTKMKAILEALSRSQAQIEFETDGTIVTANQNFLATLGYELSQIEGKHHSLFVEPGYKDSTEYRQFWDDLRAGKFQAGEFKRIAKDGAEVWIQASYNILIPNMNHLILRRLKGPSRSILHRSRSMQFGIWIEFHRSAWKRAITSIVAKQSSRVIADPS